MTKAWIGLLAAFAATVVPMAASANCYFIYGQKNQLVYRSTIVPVDLSRPISDGLKSRFPGGHLVMIPDETGCPDLLANGESQLFATLGFRSPNAGRSNTSAISASPLFRNNAGSTSTMDDPDVASPESIDTSSRLPVRRGASGGRGR